MCIRDSIKGYGKDPCINSVIAAYWMLQASLGTSPWMQRVSSTDNVSDAVSRQDLQDAHAKKWQEVKIDLDPVYQIILKAAGDMIFAHTDAMTQIRNYLQSQPGTSAMRQTLVNKGWTSPR